MRRITREELATNLYVALSVLRPALKRVLGVDVERSREEVTQMLVTRVLGQSGNEAVLIVPSLVTQQAGERHGIWERTNRTRRPTSRSPVPVARRIRSIYASAAAITRRWFASIV